MSGRCLDETSASARAPQLASVSSKLRWLTILIRSGPGVEVVQIFGKMSRGERQHSLIYRVKVKIYNVAEDISSSSDSDPEYMTEEDLKVMDVSIASSLGKFFLLYMSCSNSYNSVHMSYKKDYTNHASTRLCCIVIITMITPPTFTTDTLFTPTAEDSVLSTSAQLGRLCT